MVNEMDEEKVRTPVRVGTLRSTHMSKGGEARALRFGRGGGGGRGKAREGVHDAAQALR